MEKTFDKIVRKTGKKPTSCKCTDCKLQCAHPCLGTPEDMIKIITAGHKDDVMSIEWTGAMNLGLYDQPVNMITPKFDANRKCCTFFVDGLCQLHEKGLKPTEGRLSHPLVIYRLNRQK